MGAPDCVVHAGCCGLQDRGAVTAAWLCQRKVNPPYCRWLERKKQPKETNRCEGSLILINTPPPHGEQLGVFFFCFNISIGT